MQKYLSYSMRINCVLYSIKYMTPATSPRNGWFRPSSLSPKKQTQQHAKNINSSASWVTLKALLRVIHGRIYRRCEENSGETQFGFKNGLGGGPFSACSCWFRSVMTNGKVFMCFIDYQNAFDSMRYDLLMPLLEEIGLDVRISR